MSLFNIQSAECLKKQFKDSDNVKTLGTCNKQMTYSKRVNLCPIRTGKEG